ncbi:MAG: hypothetical protein COU07_02780 [Candidatus Harrisonbacteria bacterium CG10_big_fil_rev_8_21_14_0_10_40_38]|uniref:Uncharacterized protein n=1 Tax=Candidatus Harrisonbacteria bacterium CG10_big_fil_rev_8_21_14_0_10_40_38 TaxID=1974583 RepID=A0A2H0URT3_9BACT|nr:MAG: hypothetical protein COU07_02780 [Candidatus Harrisonbacteria bacterium CG10_big_fil_rev_8_21_14_0_10_40_38]
MKKKIEEPKNAPHLISFAVILLIGFGLYVLANFERFSDSISPSQVSDNVDLESIGNNTSDAQIEKDLRDIKLNLEQLPSDLQSFDESLYEEPLIEP